MKIVGQNTERLPNTSLIINSKMEAKNQLIALDMQDISVSTGAACSSGKISPSHVLMAMGYEQTDINSAIRVSSSLENNLTDIDNFIKIYSNINK